LGKVFRTVASIVAIVGTTACDMSHGRYVALLTTADSAMRARQDTLTREFRIGSYERYDYDEASGIFVFSDSGVAKVLADIQLVGEVSRRDSAWTWAWQFPHVAPFLVRDARAMRRYGWWHGIPLLRRTGWSADQVDGWEMTSLTGWLTGAQGDYRAPASDSSTYTFLLLRNLRWAPSGKVVSDYIKSPRSGS
jgi:hypothetical protein